MASVPSASLRRWSAGLLAIGVVGLGHALLTWPLGRVARLFGGGVVVAAVAEVAVVRAGLLRHRLAPRVAGVPLPVLGAWPAVVYGALRAALLVRPPGVAAAALAAVLAAIGDALVDPYAVRRGIWTYPNHPISAVRFRGVPWWNALGWLAVAFALALLSLG